MSSYDAQIHLDLPLRESLEACAAAVQRLGWRLVQRQDAGLTCEEVQRTLLSFGSPVRAEVRAVSLVPERTHVAIAGSNFGIGPLQSRHVRSRIEALAREIAGAAAKWVGHATPRPAAAARAVIINGARLSDEQVQALEHSYRVRLHDGSYWYDRLSGAWGYQGGPAVGLVVAGLEIGGPLRADASNGNTGVFVNGRQLHVQDVLVLQRVLPMVLPGRYWMDGAGNFGYEGGFALGNLWVLAAAAHAPREGVLSTYDKAGVAVIGEYVLTR